MNPRQTRGQLGLWPFAMLVVAFLACASAQAANKPCSGKKGGVSHCDGATFVCNDGSISASKRDCRAYLPGNSAASFTSTRGAPRKTAAQGACPCGTSTYCTGPRGGRYCLTPSGNKSYKAR